ncbi:MAG TPA: RNA polymerase subunit sigma, partial [Planctomycetaceae bacterium]
MSGPIVRTGTTPKYGENWDRIFGGTAARPAKTKAAAKPKAGAKSAVAKAEKAVAKAAGKATAAAKSAVAKVTGKA